jgi:hypothetical protein
MWFVLANYASTALNVCDGMHHGSQHDKLSTPANPLPSRRNTQLTHVQVATRLYVAMQLALTKQLHSALRLVHNDVEAAGAVFATPATPLLLWLPVGSTPELLQSATARAACWRIVGV